MSKERSPRRLRGHILRGFGSLLDITGQGARQRLAERRKEMEKVSDQDAIAGDFRQALGDLHRELEKQGFEPPSTK